MFLGYNIALPAAFLTQTMFYYSSNLHNNNNVGIVSITNTDMFLVLCSRLILPPRMGPEDIL
jgi:hypothetical protein